MLKDGEGLRSQPSDPDARTCPCSSVAQWQSIRLLTGGLLVRVQPEEPFRLISLMGKDF